MVERREGWSDDCGRQDTLQVLEVYLAECHSRQYYLLAMLLALLVRCPHLFMLASRLMDRSPMFGVGKDFDFRRT